MRLGGTGWARGLFLADGSCVVDARCGLTYGSITNTGGGNVSKLGGSVIGTSVVGNAPTVTTAGETLVYHRKPAGTPHLVYLPYLPPYCWALGTGMAWPWL